VVRACVGVTSVPSQCVHWTYGIAGTGGTAITSVQVGAVNRFVAVNWVGPFNWNTNPPTGIAALPPVLYDGPTQYSTRAAWTRSTDTTAKWTRASFEEDRRSLMNPSINKEPLLHQP
jgi:hypothetical protein